MKRIIIQILAIVATLNMCQAQCTDCNEIRDISTNPNDPKNCEVSSGHPLINTDFDWAANSNGASAFVLAPWAEGGNSDIGGMRMDKNGNTEFHGTLRATKMNVDAKWWADFVFDKEYILPSLNDVEAFIAENKHLPDMPSEAEVLENGLDLGEMQALQQQKIEELTLYIIQQQKQIDQLLKTVTQLTK
tara:strand:- start:1059 stop:1625 length:567 start_codon:yes stop_codon:yes gene_type:complete